MKRSLAIAILSLLVANGLPAQDAKSDFTKINAAYDAAQSLSMDITYDLFLDNVEKPSETLHGRYRKSKNCFYTKQNDAETIINDKYMLLVDNENKLMAIDKRPSQSYMLRPLSVNLDSLFLLYDKVEVLPQKNPSLLCYRFHIKDGPYRNCDVTFNKSTLFVTEIRNVFRNSVKDENDKAHAAVLRIAFSNISTSAVDQQVFSEKKYLVIVNKRYAPAPNYKHYQFINHLK